MFLKHIQTITAGSAVASISFSDIPQDATDLYLAISIRTTEGFQGGAAYIGFNSSTSNFTGKRLIGNGSSASSDAPARYLGDVNGGNSTASTFSNVGVYIANYANGSNKSFSVDSVFEQNTTLSAQQIIAGLWSQTAAITSIQITPGSSNLAEGTSASLYKVIAGTDRTTTVS